MRFLLVNFQDKIFDSHPLGLGYVAGALLEAGQQVDYLNLATGRGAARKLTQTIRRLNPDVLGFTLWTLNYDLIKDIVEAIPETDRPLLIAGGPHASIMYEQVLEDRLADVVVRIEGERAVPYLVKALNGKIHLEDVPGIAYRNDDHGAIRATVDPRSPADLDRLPHIPYDLLDIKIYTGRIHGSPAVVLQTSRGCPFRCLFCYRGPAAGKKIRNQSIPRVISEIEMLHDRYGFEAFNFFDDIFTLNRKRTLELCRALIDLEFDIFWICETRVDCVDEELLSMMRKAGCIEIRFGAESGDQGIIDKLKKDITLAQIQIAFDLCRKVGIPALALFLLGTPWDTAETVKRTVGFARKLKPTAAIFFAAIPYPGTALREAFIRKKIPLPTANREYYHSASKVGATDGPSEYHQHLSRVRADCRRAAAQFLLSQSVDVCSYPRHVKEFYRRYGTIGIVRRLYNLIPRKR